MNPLEIILALGQQANDALDKSEEILQKTQDLLEILEGI